MVNNRPIIGNPHVPSATESPTVSRFTLFSPTVKGTLSDEYNCNSPTTGVNPPFEWTNVPSGTDGFVLLMGSYQLDASGNPVASGFDWGIYDLPANVTSVAQNCSNPAGTTCGRAASAWNNGHADEAANYYYRPPCSSDCLIKNYTFTIYAMAKQITKPFHSLSNYNLSLLVQLPGAVLAEASMVVSSLRTRGCSQPSSSPFAPPSSNYSTPSKQTGYNLLIIICY